MFQGQGDKNYFVKIIILSLATIIGVVAIWWAMARQESIDWLSSQILHKPSGYAISLTEEGSTIVTDVINKFQITLPSGFRVIEEGDLIFYVEDQDKSICQTKSQVIKNKEAIDLDILKQQDSSLSETLIGSIKVLEKEQVSSQGDFIYELQIPQNDFIIKFTLTADKVNQERCINYFKGIKKSFIRL